MTGARTRVVRRAVTGAVVALLCAGCGTAGGTELAPDAAAELQAGVLEVSRASAQGRYDAAVAALEELREVLADAAEHGRVSAARYAEVESAVRRVEAELEKLRAAADAGAASDDAETSDGGAEDGTTDDGGADGGPSSVTVVEDAAEPVTTTRDDGSATRPGPARGAAPEGPGGGGPPGHDHADRGPKKGPGPGPGPGGGPGGGPGRGGG